MNAIFNKLQIVLYEKFSFHYEHIQLETQLELELGMDSREMFELLNEVEKTFNITIDLNEIDNLLENSQTLMINDLVRYINEKQLLK